MIETVLTKCLENLQTEVPDLSYIRGMLEVLLAAQPQKATAGVLTPVTPLAVEVPTNEGVILDGIAKAGIDKIKQLASKTTEYA